MVHVKVIINNKIRADQLGHALLQGQHMLGYFKLSES